MKTQGTRLIAVRFGMVVVLACGWCASAAEKAASIPNRTAAHSITEKADNGKDFPVTANTRKVDANSDLLVNFQSFTNVTPAPPSPDWLRASNVLQLVETISKERAALQARYKSLDLSNAQEVEKLRAGNQEFDLHVVGLFDQWQKDLRIENDAAFEKILTGEFDGQKNPLRPYANLGRWTKRELERLNRNASTLVSNRTVLVTVQAFHAPIGGLLRAVHVDNYDNIPAGELQPIDRLGLRLTPAEQERLAMEMQMAEQARDAIREIQSGTKDMGAFASNLLAQLKARLDEIEDIAKKGPLGWELKLSDAAFLDALKGIAQNPALTPKQRAAAASNMIYLAEFKDDLAAVKSAILSIQLLKSDLATSQAHSLTELISQTGPVLTALSKIEAVVRTFADRVAKWPARLETMAANFNELQNQLAADQRAALLPDEVKQFVEKVRDSFPRTFQTIATVRQLLSNDKGIGEAAAALAETELQSIWRDDMTPGLLELARVGLVQDDHILLSVRYHEKGTNGMPGRFIAKDDYKMQTVLMGLHRKFGANVILARGLGDHVDERQWKPNVAATVHWFYRIRDDSDAWSRAWNYVNPGLGLHLASLDQGKESVEFGTGVNVSLFDNLLSGGIGVNLSNNEHPYVYFGISLLDALNKAKSLGANKQ